MRLSPFALCLLVGCGSVRLGNEAIDAIEVVERAPGLDAAATLDAVAPELDAAAASTLDAATPDVQVVVTLKVDDDCASCVELTASGGQGTPPYTFLWDDGSTDPRRRVCAPVSQDALAVTVTDARGFRSAPRSTRLDLPAARCAIDSGTPSLCLQNPSFEGTPGYNPGLPVLFDVKPWTDCTNPSRNNTPDVVSDPVPQYEATLPPPVDGKTFLGLLEGEQASQALCAPVRGGEVRFIRLYARRLDITANVVPDTESASLQIFGGTSANCKPIELLWSSSKLPESWQSFCVALAPQQFMDFITLKAVSDESLPSSTYLLVDHIVPVDSCP